MKQVKNMKLASSRNRDSPVSSLRNTFLFKNNVCSHRYTVKVQRELELDECAIHALTEDRQRFLCKAVENYISCLLSGEEHDMWIFRLCSLWLENSGVDRVNEMMKVHLLLFFLITFLHSVIHLLLLFVGDELCCAVWFSLYFLNFSIKACLFWSLLLNGELLIIDSCHSHCILIFFQFNEAF